MNSKNPNDNSSIAFYAERTFRGHPNLKEFEKVVPQETVVIEQIEELDLQQIEDQQQMAQQGIIYEGSLNQNGQKHGYGKSIDPDGSIYEGQWEKNLKNGYGTITYSKKYLCIDSSKINVCFGTDAARSLPKRKFEGNFVNGMKNGLGILYMGYGYVLHANWVNDMIHGEVQIVMKDGSKIDCLFYKNSKIQLSGIEGESQEKGIQDDGSTSYDCIMLSFFTFFTFYIGIAFLFAMPLLYIPGIIFLVIGLTLGAIDLYYSITMSYLKNKKEFSAVSQELDKLKKVPIQLNMYIQNYTLRRKGRKLYDHKATKPYRYIRWLDRSGDLMSMDNAINHSMLRISTLTNFDYTVDARCSYEWQKNEFFKNNKTKSSYIYSDNFSMQNSAQYFLGYDPKQKTSCFAVVLLNPILYAFMSMIGLSWITKIYIYGNVKKLNYSHNRLIIQ